MAISDVPGDGPVSHRLGPTVADDTTAQDAREILERYGIELSEAVVAFLDDAAAETPKPGDPRLAKTDMVLIATPADSSKLRPQFADGQKLSPRC